MALSPALPRPPLAANHAGTSVLGVVGRVVEAGRQPVPAESAAAFRIVFGLLGVATVVRFAANGWISELYLEPAHHFTYYGFGWVQAWPGWGMYAHFALLGLASLGVALGYRYRLCMAAFFLLFTYVELIDQTTYLNHYYLVSVLALLMVFLPLHRAASLDARRGPAAQAPPTIPRVVLWALRAQIGLVYVFAGVAKLNADWLLHAEPLRIWLYNTTDVPLIGLFARDAWLAYGMSWAGALFDLTIVGWLLWRRSRPYAYAVLVAFHVATGVLFPSIGMFPWIMIAATLLFFDPDWPARIATRVRGAVGRTTPRAPAPSLPTGAQPLSWPVRAALVLGGLFLAVQVLAPLRHLAYPGDVRWTEEGYRFSWRVLVTEKTGLVKYRVTSQDTGVERLVYPDEYLTPLQVERFAHQPDMVLAAAHLIRDDFTARGHQGVEVRADAFVAYNGRAAARLIDPDVDLARIEPGVGAKGWVLAAPP